MLLKNAIQKAAQIESVVPKFCKSTEPQMRSISPVIILLGLSIAAPSALIGQNYSGLSVTNYKLISQEQLTRTQSNFVYRADLVNTGLAQPALTAIVTSKIASIVVVPGQGNLHFPPVPANGRVISTNTFTVTVDRSVPSDFVTLMWNFGAPVANAGPDQSVGVGVLVTLDGSRTTNPSGIGALTYDWVFFSRPPGTRVVLQGADTPMPSFTADVQGDFVLTLRASNGAGTDMSSVTVHVGPATARKPTANAGAGQTVKPPGTTVTLNGSGSTDPDGNPLTYHWTLTALPAGSTALLSSMASITPTFVADKPGTYMARLIVNNGTYDSDPSFVTITDVNTRPVANAGLPQSVSAGAAVQLDGSKSTDTDGNPLTYQWALNSVPAGSKATLSSFTGVNPTFVVDLAGVYVAQLIVNDGFDNSDAATVTITASTVTPQKPTANAGLPQSIQHGSLVTLNGSGTDPQGKTLTFKWALIGKPTGSTANLANPTSQNPTFTADLPGTYIAQLIVNNGSVDSDPSTVTISSSDIPPVSNAGPNQTVSTGTTVTLDGTGSSDAEHDPLTYSWTLTTLPAGSTATLIFPTSAHPTFVADLAGTYVAQLIVKDSFASGLAASTVSITAVSSGIILTPNPLNLSNVAGTLTASIASPAGSSGQVIKLTSFDTTIVTVPPSVTIAPNTTSVSFTVTPVGVGSANIIASSPGFQPGSATVNVIQPTLDISLSGNTVGVSRSVTGTVTLNAPAAVGGVLVSLTADRSGIVTIPTSVNVVAGSKTVTFTVTGAAVGSANITASSPGYLSRSAAITVGQLGQITLASNVTVGPGQTLPFAVSLVSAAPTGGVTINLVSSDTSKLTVSPSVFIAAGATTPDTPAQITGVNFGSASISASASGFASDTKTVQTAANLSFTPTSLTVGVGGPQNVTLNLSGPAPAGGLSVNLSSSNTGAATVPANIAIPQGATTVSVPVTGVSAGQSTVITASSSTPGVVSATLNVSVISGVVISTTTLPNGAVNAAYSAAVTATGGTTPYTFTATGLPAGLSLSATGQITGIPTVSGTGTSTVTLTVTDSTSPKLTATANLTLTINPALAITTTSLPTGTVNSAYTASVTATGGTTPYSFTATGLPTGLSISSTGQITGIPAASGTFTVAVTVMDSTSPKLTASANLTLTVNAALAVTTASLPGGTVNSPYNATLAAIGGTTPYTFTATGLPAGLALSPTGQITGTPNVAGNFTLTVTVTDSTTPTVLGSNATLSLAIAPPALAITTASLSGGTVGVPYSAAVVAIGGTTPYNFSATGLPAGLIINGAGQISGTPTTAGNFTAAVTVIDSGSSAQTKTGNITISIAPPTLAISTTSLLGGTVNVAYSAAVTATGGTTPYNFSGTGLPAGLSISLSGQISGTPTAAGNFTIAVTVSDASSPVQTKTGNVTIAIAPPALTLTTTSLLGGTVNVAYSAAITATGGTTPYIFSGTGLPAGLSINAAGQISGTPTAAGTFTIAATVSDASSPVQTKTSNVTIAIAQPALALTTSLSGGTVNVVYSAAVTATGGTTPYNFSGTGLPAGLSISTAGQISGTPTAAGNFTISVTVFDASSPVQTKTGNVTIVIAPPALTLTTTSLLGGTVNVVYSAAVTATGGTTPYNFSGTGLPAGLSISLSGQISGTPTAAGNFTIAVTVSDASSPVQTKTGNVTIAIAPQPLAITTGSLPGGMVGVQYNANLGASGGIQPYNFGASGLPAGLNITADGHISGFPTAAGTFNVIATVLDSNNPRQSATANLSIVIQSQSGGSFLTITGASIGQDLQVPVTITLSAPAPGPIVVTVSSDNPNLLLGGASQPGASSINVNLAAGATSFSTFAKSLAGSGSANLTASASTGYTSGTSKIVLNPSGFVIAGVNGVGGNFNVNQGSSAPLTVSSAQLDVNGNFVQIEQLRGGMIDAQTGNPRIVTVTLSNSNSSAGTVSPSSLSFTSGIDSLTSQFTASASSTSSTVISVTVPPGFSTSTAGSVVASVQQATISPGNVTVGHGLETTTNVSLQGTAQADLQVTLTSKDPSKVLLSLDGVSAGQTSITTKIGVGRNRTQDFYVYGGTPGTSGYTAAVDTFGTADGTVTIGNSGFYLVSPFGFGADHFNTTTLSSPSEIDVFPALLDASGIPISTQLIAGGTTVNVNVTSSATSVGTITTSPVTFTGGADQAITNFQPASVGSTTITVVAPAGFATPAQSSTVVAVVGTPKVAVQNIDILGNNLEVQSTLFLSAPAPAGGVTVTLTSSDASLLMFSSTATGNGSGTLQILVPAGNTGVNFFLYGKSGAGTPTYNAAAPGFTSSSASVNLAPTGIIIFGPSGPGGSNQPAFELDTTVAAGPTPLSVSTAVLDGTGNSVQTQPLQGGASVTVSLTTTPNTAGVGTITTPITITPSNDTANSTFTPHGTGQTTVSVARPLNFTTPSNNTSILVKVQ